MIKKLKLWRPKKVFIVEAFLMKFIDPSFTELYNTLKNNKRLEKFFINQYILNSIDDYYENYGYNNQKYKGIYGSEQLV